ncbi:hypothetical protein [Georgenia sp. SUBG003]|uniref:hypothetical protein n=1 Tax=Georgenia sp. SUBG003 TaxID=1497974 RepID=UPI003AB745A9
MTAEGEALEYTLGTNLADPSVVGSEELAAALEQSAEFTVNGDDVTDPLTAAVGTRTVVVTAKIVFPYESGNETQLQTVNLKNVVLRASQVGPNAV